jgi:phage replication O-like protein O
MKQINHTQIPNYFLDECLPKLKGSEIQVFLIICRQTIGWHKETDRISTSQLEDKTGLSNRCIIDACRGLKDKELINFEMKDGIKSFEVCYEESSQEEKVPMKKVHRGYEESSQAAYEESSHTKETVTKQTKQKKESARVNGCPIPEPLQVEGFKERYGSYLAYLKETHKLTPSIQSVESNYRKLIELKQAGNDPLKVMDQTMNAVNKSFYALRSFDDNSDDNSKEQERPKQLIV